MGELREFGASRSNPLENVRAQAAYLRGLVESSHPAISIDVTTFTRKHLLQLLHAFDAAGLLSNCQFLYTEPKEYPTSDNDIRAEGVASIRAVDTFCGRNLPSRDSTLVLFLGYEGRRALALWEHLEPNRTFAVIPDPPYRAEWMGRAELHNRFLLSSLAEESVLRSHSLRSLDTTVLLSGLIRQCGVDRYNFLIAPMGTKAQVIGMYRYWRTAPGSVTVVYARPVKYREDAMAGVPPADTWVLGHTSSWTGGAVR
jgi:hypothetical protein